MKEPIKVSVIIPAFNSSACIKSAIDSVLYQTYPVAEIIVVNNNSTDNTEEIVLSFGPLLKLLNCEIQGVSNARNLGVVNATSEFIAFLDSDDVWKENKLESQVKIINESEKELSIVGCYADFMVRGKKIGGSIRSDNDEAALENFKKLGDLPCITSSWLLSRSGYLNLGGMDPKVHTAEDFEFACKAIASGFIFQISREYLIQYNISPGTITHRNYNEQYFRAQYYRTKYFTNNFDLGYDEFQKTISPFGRLNIQSKTSKYIRLALVNFADKNYMLAVLLLFGALILNPSATVKKALKQLRWN